ncbi:MAG: helix-turn-helix transcriptional regulator [Thermoleophilia bacterium]|nr:helix-turn-helix transcriptional regulator [Thermoleophilia bacterium]
MRYAARSRSCSDPLVKKAKLQYVLISGVRRKTMRRELAGGIGGRIARARKEHGLTQEELAALVGVSPRSIQGYEAGKVVPYRRLGRIAEVTDRQLHWLLEGDGEPVADVVEQLARLVEELTVEARRIRVVAERLQEVLDAAAGRAGQVPAA